MYWIFNVLLLNTAVHQVAIREPACRQTGNEVKELKKNLRRRFFSSVLLLLKHLLTYSAINLRMMHLCLK